MLAAHVGSSYAGMRLPGRADSSVYSSDMHLRWHMLSAEPYLRSRCEVNRLVSELSNEVALYPREQRQGDHC